MLPLANLPTYTAAELERLAERFLREQIGSEVPIPVDVEWLVEELEDIDFDAWPNLRARHAIEGCVVRDLASGRIFIYVDDDLMDDDSPRGRGRYRYTVAEELAHVRLHRQVIDQISSIDDFRELQNDPKWYDLERNAKRFAAALLMPAKSLVSEASSVYTQLAQKVGTDNPAAVKKWLRSLLAKRFEVSESTMDYRLGEWPIRVYQRVEEAMRRGYDYLA